MGNFSMTLSLKEKNTGKKCVQILGKFRRQKMNTDIALYLQEVIILGEH